MKQRIVAVVLALGLADQIIVSTSFSGAHAAGEYCLKTPVDRVCFKNEGKLASSNFKTTITFPTKGARYSLQAMQVEYQDCNAVVSPDGTAVQVLASYSVHNNSPTLVSLILDLRTGSVYTLDGQDLPRAFDPFNTPLRRPFYFGKWVGPQTWSVSSGDGSQPMQYSLPGTSVAQAGAGMGSISESPVPKQVRVYREAKPKQVEPGAVARIFVSRDVISLNFQNPREDSPLRILAVDTLVSLPIAFTEYQEVSGYFYVASAGTYNFQITPVSGLGNPPCALSVDGLNIARGYSGDKPQGRIQLRPGWHRIGLMTKGESNQSNQAYVSWAKAGSVFVPLDAVYREVAVSSPRY